MSIIPSVFGRKHAKNMNNNTDETMNVDIWDPFEAISFAAAAASLPITTPAFATANLDWKETPNAHVFITDLPGVKNNEVKIEVEEEKVLKISGQRSKEAEEKGDKWHRIERSNEKFLRTVRLPSNANVDGMKAVMENGVLKVTVPKEQESKTRGRLIPITN
ncbi:class I heat shock protein-like protein [Carex littledalei]|uniref:Class I heat shock protein-like protein n=1 Tax=Carex littledalei TaxID=544730 RepID=A0A833R6G5_9POAL|nr:class I heat shock protein-like protein [Carex littledalei]